MERVKGGEKKYSNEGVVGTCDVVVLDSPCVPGGWRTAGGENVYNWFASSGVWCDTSEILSCSTLRDCFWENTSEGASGGEGCFSGLLIGLLAGKVALLSGTGSRVVYGDSFVSTRLLIVCQKMK